VFLCFYTDGLFPRVYYTEKRKTKRKKNSNVPNQNLLESASRRASTERRKNKKNYFCVFGTKKVFLSLSSL